MKAKVKGRTFLQHIGRPHLDIPQCRIQMLKTRTNLNIKLILVYTQAVMLLIPSLMIHVVLRKFKNIFVKKSLNFNGENFYFVFVSVILNLSHI